MHLPDFANAYVSSDAEVKHTLTRFGREIDTPIEKQNEHERNFWKDVISRRFPLSTGVFFDLLDGCPPIRVRASITLLSSESGGKKHPVRKGYSPNHNFGDSTNSEFYVGRLQLDEQDSLAPGETWELVVHFLSGRGLREKFTPGTSWRIQEGAKLVGEGTVLEVLKS